MEANAIFDILQRGRMWLAEGLETFTAPVPESLVGRTIATCGLRQDTGCHVLAVRRKNAGAIAPDITSPLESGAELVLIGGREQSRAFFEKYGYHRRPQRSPGDGHAQISRQSELHT